MMASHQELARMLALGSLPRVPKIFDFSVPKSLIKFLRNSAQFLNLDRDSQFLYVAFQI